MNWSYFLSDLKIMDQSVYPGMNYETALAIFENMLSSAVDDLDEERVGQYTYALTHFALTNISVMEPHLSKPVMRARQALRKQMKKIPAKPTSKDEAECLLHLYTQCFKLEVFNYFTRFWRWQCSEFLVFDIIMAPFN